MRANFEMFDFSQHKLNCYLVFNNSLVFVGSLFVPTKLGAKFIIGGHICRPIAEPLATPLYVG